MNFQMLKGLVEDLVESYECSECQSKIDDSNIEIMWTAGSNINVEVWCPQCKKLIIVRAQMFSTDVLMDKLDNKKKEQIQKQIGKLEEILTQKKSIPNDIIKDTHIVSLSKKLKIKNVEITDLFSD